jgi:hypothetical protein
VVVSFNRWRKSEYPEKTTDLSQVTDKLWKFNYREWRTIVIHWYQNENLFFLWPEWESVVLMTRMMSKKYLSWWFPSLMTVERKLMGIDSWKETDGKWQLKGNWWELTVERKLMGIDSWKETDGKWQLKGNWWEFWVRNLTTVVIKNIMKI